jgi:peptidoglycan/xylan/chitin deacetylase (PgdA/CDA1 family)
VSGSWRSLIVAARALAKPLLCGWFYYSGLTVLMARWFPRRRPVILCIHRVVSEDDPFFPGIPREQFAAEVAYLARHHRVLPLAELVEAMLAGRPLPRGAVAITFDDGFADNFHLAYPILQRYGVPATIFLVFESIETGRFPWPERVAYLLQRTQRTRLEISRPEPRVFSLRSQAEKLAAFATLLRLLKTCETEVRRRAVDDLEAELSVGPDQGMMLTWEQCQRMAQSVVSFGSHTLTHPILPQTQAEEVKHEIATSKALIEARLGRRVRYFAYPNDEFSRAALDAVEGAGLEAAFAGDRYVAQASVDRFTIGRRPWGLGHVSVFAAEVSGLLDGLRDLLSLLS